MANSMKHNDKQAIYPSSVAIILLIGGFSCFIAWPFISLLNAAELPFENTLNLALDPIKILAPLGAFVTLLYALRPSFAQAVYRHRSSPLLFAGVALIIAVLPVAESLALLDYSVPAVLFAGLWFINGIVFALMLLLWGAAWDFYIKQYGKSDLLVGLIVSVGIAALICVGAAFMQPIFFIIISAALPLFSLVLLRILTGLSMSSSGRETAPVDAVVYFPGRQAAYVVAISTYWSFMVTNCMGAIGAKQTLVLSSVSILVSCIIFAVIAVTRKVLPRYLLVERVAFPIAISGTILSPFLDNPLIAGGVVFATTLGTAAFMTSHWELMVKWTRRYALQPIYLYSFGTFTLAGGFFIGSLLIFVFGVLEAPVALSTIITCLCFLFIIVTISAFTPFDSESDFNTYEHITLRVQNEEGAWRTIIHEISAEHGLTAREAEVMLFLSRGRNTKYISSKLHISDHTTKSHVYRIYQKLEVNGLQELIDLVDDRRQENRRNIKGARTAE